MRFSKAKQNSIRAYILEKVDQKLPNLTAHVAEVFSINRDTAYEYINRLVKEGLIKRVRRGEYAMVQTKYVYDFEHPQSESHIFNEVLKPHIAEFEPNVRLIWEYAFTEMVNNVIDHSGSDTLRITIFCDAQRTHVTISDRGVGIFEKIKTHFDLLTLEDAIFELFKGKLTTDSSRHSGEGIFFTSRLMDHFFIFSDQKIFTHNKYDESSISDFAIDDRGTLVYMSLSNDSQKQITAVFNRYSSVDGGFSKTSVLLRHIFDSAPVSRSQAKRVCDRLEQFSEVTLDFEGIEWMGQGFAHQIFVLFAAAHPELTLFPVNMNEAVEQMYRHVTNSR